MWKLPLLEQTNKHKKSFVVFFFWLVDFSHILFRIGKNKARRTKRKNQLTSRLLTLHTYVLGSYLFAADIVLIRCIAIISFPFIHSTCVLSTSKQSSIQWNINTRYIYIHTLAVLREVLVGLCRFCWCNSCSHQHNAKSRKSESVWERERIEVKGTQKKEERTQWVVRDTFFFSFCLYQVHKFTFVYLKDDNTLISYVYRHPSNESASLCHENREWRRRANEKKTCDTIAKCCIQA